jgi:hypothetical protein
MFQQETRKRVVDLSTLATPISQPGSIQIYPLHISSVEKPPSLEGQRVDEHLEVKQWKKR